MNENLDLREILKDVPEGTKLYSPIFGEVEFLKISNEDAYPVKVKAFNKKIKGDLFEQFTDDGRYYKFFSGTECQLFPSKDQRDWSKFQAPKPERKKIQVHLMPFDKVLARDDEGNDWHIDLYEKYEYGTLYPYICLRSAYNQVIPYNEDTRPLICTTNTPTIDYEIVAWNQK